MPCYDGGWERSAYEFKSRLDKATAALCSTLETWEQSGRPFPLTSEAHAWWEDHKAFDKRRKESEASGRRKKDDIERAKSKLTPDEQRLLGLR
jgi:hypothetical protein